MPVEVKIYGDNRVLLDKKFKLGQSENVSIKVTGVLRLEIDHERARRDGA